MKQLDEILKGVKILQVEGPEQVIITSIVLDSREVSNGALFVAISGTQTDGHKFIGMAAEKGAVAVVCEEMPQKKEKQVTYILVRDSSFAVGQIAANFYENPSKSLKLVGVTGTNGKTTIVTLLHRLFINLGYKAGLLSTIVNKVQNREIKTENTTPDAITINKVLKEMVDEGCEFAFMEVSSHAVVQERIAGLEFAGAVFTNITHDHLDYHKTFQEYIRAKKKFFDDLTASAFALVNVDDRNAEVVLQNTKAKKYSFGLKTMADFKGRVLENEIEGLKMRIDNEELYSLLVGGFNASNLLAIYSVAILLDQKKEEVLSVLSTLRGAEGRFEVLRSSKGITGIVDYAHTPDALKNVLETIKTVRSGDSRLTTVVGAGGDRDKTKRPVMASIAAQYSDRVILTSDNPRTEDPEAILADMMAGIDPVQKRYTIVISNRSEAIKAAINFSEKGDIILVAGKGHEKYQDIKGVKYPFDDKKILKELFEQA
ncbi:MAG: UDP-N-acetylmuramoyl-L-alanyl-D-glutamate--2,6-diaminopimelate ligase [Bacteroidales bacterium]|nr:UDP-N-acetylmuramoyl-L-alanyl-D-glutamate--2,6-diaminopimelate ligase [Bacteroidales bacterium]